MPRQTRLEARSLSKLTAARGPDRLHALELQMIQANPSYRFTSERAQRTSHKHGSHSSLLALKPVATSRHTSDPNLGGGARVAQATREEGPINSTTTEEVER